jgi:transcriptional regulator with XRE-family HTH domain
MVDGGSPLVQRRRLRSELRKAREARGLTQEQVASEMDWSLSKIIRIEAASSGISVNDLKALLRLYEIKDPNRVNFLLQLARAAKDRSWWRAYRDIAPSAYRDVAPSSLLQLIEYESVASTIRQFEMVFIPGILQTADYARAVIRDYYDEKLESDKIDALVELRVKREQLLESENHPSFYFMIDEAVVHRLVGGSRVMQRQLRHLIEVAKKPTIAMEIIPFAAGMHLGMKGAFEIIEFADPSDSGIVFLESPRGDIIIDDAEETLSYRKVFETLRKSSLDPSDSLALLGRIADEMS